MGLDDSFDPHILLFAEGRDRIPELGDGEIGVQTSVFRVRGVENTITKIESVVGSLLGSTVRGSGLEITRVDHVPIGLKYSSGFALFQTKGASIVAIY